MNAKSNDLARIQEIWDVGVQTRNQIASLGFTKSRFLEPKSDSDDLIGEGIMNRVLRLTEEAGRISESVAREYGFERQAASGAKQVGACVRRSGQGNHLASYRAGFACLT